MLYNPKECRGNPFLLLENSRPLSTWGPLNFLSTCLGIYFLACSPRDSQESSPAPQFQPINSSALSLLYSPALTSVHDYWKNHALTILIFVGQVMPVLFNTVSSFVIAFLPKNKHLLISWLQSPSAVILESPKIKSATVSTVSPSIYHEMMGLDESERGE